jgi:Ca2+-binding EF-hand superfamily protein
MNKIQFKISQEEVTEVFHIIDKSKNGVITLDELAQIAKKS